MGVTFQCPNGHPVRAHAALAGKMGVCPDCGAKVRIPEISAPERPALASAESSAESAPPRAGGQAAVVQTILHAGPVLSPGDPIDQAPAAMWFVRPPSGGQFGPAKGEVLRQWLREGRVPTDSLVWREGWAEWKHAGATFPASSAQRWADGVVVPDGPIPRDIPVSSAAPSEMVPLVSTDDDLHSIDPRVRRTLQRRKTERRAVLWLLGLGAVSVLLFAGLLYVLLRQT